MPGCVAVGCNNRSEKGFIMKCFPRDSTLRKIWQERVARADWEPSNNSFLCHVHFEPQEWSITQSGRIKLKKDAVPSIFTITSTRKSPNKRTKVIDINEKDVSQSKYDVERIGNDIEYLSTEHVEEKDSDFQDADEQSIQFIKTEFKYVPESVEEEEEEEEEEESIDSDYQEQTVVMIDEDNLANINGPAKQDREPQMNDINEKVDLSLIINQTESTRTPSSIAKDKIKLENMDCNALEDSYDEIEEKLKQICDGGSTEDEHFKNKEKPKLVIKSGKDDEDVEMIDVNSEFRKNEHKAPVSVATNNDFPMRIEAVHTLTDKEENVEIIFGIESGDEKASLSQVKSKTNKLDDIPVEYNEMTSVKDEKKVFNEDIEENFSKEEVHVIPNIRAAMKRKKKTREEIMKSIKKSIRSTSDQDIHSSTNSELSDSIERETKTRDESPVSLQGISDISKRNDTDMDTAKFIIKVTGDPDDVSEIIEELSLNRTNACVPPKFDTLYKIEEDNAFVTSVITVVSPRNSEEITYNNLSSPLIKDDYVTLNKNLSVVDHSPCEEGEFLALDAVPNPKTCPTLSIKHISSDEESKNQARNSTPQKCTHSVQSSTEHDTKCCVSPDHEDLLVRMQIQEDVIAKLTDQLIIYKELEYSARNKSTGRDVQAKDIETSRISTRSSNAQSFTVTKKILESKQRLIEDLSNRVNCFEELNKKLMKTVTLESQQKRKLEGQIKQKDNRIKELNWKLEKASKYLERAEKNTNTYRRKMLNMQTVIRRRKLLDENMSKFNEMLIDSSKQEYSEKALTMAADIRKTCGRNGYDKLLFYGFPLPPLPALRKGTLSEDTMDHKNGTDKSPNSSTKLDVKTKEEDANESEVDEKDSELVDSVTKTEYDGAETVTGTVQDIFDENNDGDDFSTNELREHFILQLNAVM